MDFIQIFIPMLLTVGVGMVLIGIGSVKPSWSRAACSALGILLSVRYAIWRVTAAMPVGQSLPQQIWAWAFVTFECGSLLSSVLVLLTMAKYRNRTADADARQNSAMHEAPVDVMIATYNESHEILERTIIGAQAIRHDDLRVWVLDDGAREWVRDLAAELGAEYVSRVKGKHAKAGNVNNGLAHALIKGRRPEFLLLLDADFVPRTEILNRTLGLFEDETVGIVQTPQHFFNADPMQSNLFCSEVWPDEQRFFFNILLPCKDAWGAAFCCGTSAVLRVAALEISGGMATETVTEDMLTSFRMEEFGFKTIYLNEPLSMGLAPEGVQEYLNQRSRWCLGALQQMYTRWSFAGSARLSFISRLSFFDVILYWTTKSTFQMMLLLSPLVYWTTRTAVVQATMPDLIYYLGPMVAANLMFMSYFSKNRVMPIVTDVATMLSSFTIFRTLAKGLFQPRGHAFKVTAKGLSKANAQVHWDLFLPFAFLAWASLAGMMWSIRSNSFLNGIPGYELNIVWTLVSAAIFSLTALVTVEQPRRRKQERFKCGESADLYTDSGVFRCVVKDISMTGAMLSRPEGWVEGVKPVELVFDYGALRLSVDAASMTGASIVVQFTEAVPRRQLIEKIFTGSYNNDVKEVRPIRALSSIFINLFG